MKLVLILLAFVTFLAFVALLIGGLEKLLYFLKDLIFLRFRKSKKDRAFFQADRWLNIITYLLLGLFWIGFAGYEVYDHYSFYGGAKTATADILQADWKPHLGRGAGVDWTLMVQFKDEQNKVIKTNLADYADRGEYQVGAKLKVFYRPENENKVKVEDDQFWVATILFVFIGLVLMIGGPWVYSKPKKAESGQNAPSPDDDRHLTNLGMELLHQPPPRNVGLRPFDEMKGDWIIFMIAAIVPWTATMISFLYYYCPAVTLLLGITPPTTHSWKDHGLPYLLGGASVWVTGWLISTLRKDWVLFKYGVPVKGEVVDVIITHATQGSSGESYANVKFVYKGQENKIRSDFVNKPKNGDTALVLVDPKNPKNCGAYFKGDRSMVIVKP